MKIYKFESRQLLPVSIDEAWEFFSSPVNLQEITPDTLNFEIIGELPEKMYAGMIIIYKVKPLPGYKTNWVTEITKAIKPHYFIDEQRFGPYKFWHHQHIFEQTENKTLMRDIIHYGLPFGFAGRIANSLIVKKQLQQIFDFRFKYLDKKYNSAQ